jgi:hypothetical protein
LELCIGLINQPTDGRHHADAARSSGARWAKLEAQVAGLKRIRTGTISRAVVGSLR